MKLDKTIHRLAAGTSHNNLRSAGVDIGIALVNSLRSDLDSLRKLRAALGRAMGQATDKFDYGYRSALADVLAAYDVELTPVFEEIEVARHQERIESINAFLARMPKDLMFERLDLMVRRDEAVKALEVWRNYKNYRGVEAMRSAGVWVPGDERARLGHEDGMVLAVQSSKPFRGIELPFGKAEPGESPVDNARRELAEETGMVVGAIELVYERDLSGMMCSLFMATTVTPPTDNLASSSEGIPKWVRVHELFHGPFGEYNREAAKAIRRLRGVE